MTRVHEFSAVAWVGPLSDVLSFQLGAQVEDSVSPDSDEYTYTDGVESETRGGNNLSARFVFTPSDKLDVKLTFTHDETDDGPGATFYATQASAASCYESSNGFTYEGDMGTVVSADGEFDCEFERDTDAGLQAVNNIERYYNENADALQALVDAAVAAGATDITTSSGNTYTVEEAILAVAAGYSIPDEDVGSQSERDRILAQFDYLLDNDSMLQLSLMTSKEEYIRQSNPLNAAEPYEITYDADTGYYSYGDNVMGMVDVPSADPTTIDEQYAELRWASPGNRSPALGTWRFLL